MNFCSQSLIFSQRCLSYKTLFYLCPNNVITHLMKVEMWCAGRLLQLIFANREIFFKFAFFWIFDWASLWVIQLMPMAILNHFSDSASPVAILNLWKLEVRQIFVLNGPYRFSDLEWRLEISLAFSTSLLLPKHVARFDHFLHYFRNLNSK